MTTAVVTDDQLGMLARRQHELFRRVREGTLPVDRVMAALQGTIEGNFGAAPKPSGRMIDCDVQPFIPDGWSIRSEDQIASRILGQLEFDPTKVKFHLEEAQKTGPVVGTELLKQLEGKPVLPANVLDGLLANTAIIPDSWKQRDEQGNIRYVCFWGTVYRDSDGYRCVRYLDWRRGQWHWYYYYLANGVDGQYPAAVALAS